MYAECLKIMISFHGLNSLTDGEQEVERMLRYFLDGLVNYAKEHALKNWFKTDAYFHVRERTNKSSKR